MRWIKCKIKRDVVSNSSSTQQILLFVWWLDYMTSDDVLRQIYFLIRILRELFRFDDVISFLPPANEMWGKVMFYTCVSFCSQGVRWVCSGGLCIQEGFGQTPPSDTMDTVNKRAVRIILECILVQDEVSHFKNWVCFNHLWVLFLTSNHTFI